MNAERDLKVGTQVIICYRGARRSGQTLGRIQELSKSATDWQITVGGVPYVVESYEICETDNPRITVFAQGWNDPSPD